MPESLPLPPTGALPVPARPQRIHRLPRRFVDKLPEAEPAVVAATSDEPRPIIPRVRLIVHDAFKTVTNSFHILRFFPNRPSYDPEAFVLPQDLANFPESTEHDSPTSEGASAALPPPPYPYSSMSVYRLMQWVNSGSNLKSESEVNRLVNDVIRAEDFQADDFNSKFKFDVGREHQKFDDAINSSSLLKDGWREATVDIKIPAGEDQATDTHVFSVPGFRYRPLVEVIKAAFTDAQARLFHFSPFRRIFVSPLTGHETRIYDELYTSDAWLNAQQDLQRAANEPGCKLEKVIAALMFWSDATHLASFGTAKAWPLYMFFGNLSKYIRAKPNSGACHQTAFFPSLPDSINDFLRTLNISSNQQKALLTHCRRELMHEAWKLLLDAEFVHAYIHGIVLKCADGVYRRVYPRIFTYSADYPEKVLLANIRDNGICLCPRCLVPKKKADQMGLIYDLKLRVRLARTYLFDEITRARDFIFNKGYMVGSAAVERLCKPQSIVPTMNAFVERLGSMFNPFQMLVVDQMHEFELGVFKAVLIHIIRVLYAAGKTKKEQLWTLFPRFRQVPTFGVDTIRKFSNNVSEMKKLGARDFEDILQNLIPVVDGLLDEPYNSFLLTLLFRLAEWHALAKLRMHTDLTLERLKNCSTIVGKELRRFRDWSRDFDTVELPKEVNIRVRRAAKKSETEASRHNETESQPVPASSPHPGPQKRQLNINTYKFHAIGDYAPTIPVFGTTDSYSTQTGELAHRTVKGAYARTNKSHAMKQIANHEQRRRHFRRQLGMHGTESVYPIKGSKKDSRKSGCAELHHIISESRRYRHDIISFVHQNSQDPAKTNHLLTRLLGHDFDGDDETYSDAQRASVHIVSNRIYAHKTMRINYTSYDMRRDQDSINPRTHNDVMMVSPETGDHAHPFWYARVLGIFHAQVCHTGPEARSHSVQNMEFLWVRWYGTEPGYRWGYKRARLPKIGFVPVDDEGAFGFLDPSLVLRACHLTPVFSSGRTRTLLDFSPSAARHPGEDEDWVNYYVMIFVDRDMCMRYLGGGIGHGADPNLKDNDSRREVENTDETGNDERDDDASVGEDIEEDDEDDGEDQCSEDSGDTEDLSEEGADSDSDASVESGYFDVEDTGFADL
ncbi:hypothetical protein EV421DRAFT_1724714 [Armillaria borealis]|uniref:Uncharacterized protein n=1 Tax=Armillaria borealis TaxID=47425 RepID=A0AA39M5X2_9AGAR|nr:hypothetical protein EV421DRAFT_1724714 [Armillaria borealis]